MNLTDPPNQNLPALARTVSKGNRGQVNLVLSRVTKSVKVEFVTAHKKN